MISPMKLEVKIVQVASILNPHHTAAGIVDAYIGFSYQVCFAKQGFNFCAKDKDLLNKEKEKNGNIRWRV